MERLTWALKAAHDPFTPQDVRAQAFQICEEVKTSFDSSYHGAVALLSSADDTHRHFALHLLEDLSNTKWNALSPEQHEVLKRTALDLVRTGSRGVGLEHHFVKSKISKNVTDLAKREWPQRWPTLTDALLELARQQV